MAVISVRIDDEIKKRMEKLSTINWSEVIRNELIKAIERFEKRNIAKALLINESIKKKAPEGHDSTEIIRQWRDERYGKSGN